MELKTGDILHGFTVRYAQPIPSLKATLYRMEYTKNGADLVWLDRPDDNKTFSIAFKTIPSDHTGVFHILEHSVLCGSRKYPVREPFVELLKSSLQTFLNAITFPDKTMYPVSSRNDQDFLNLMDVYMDAVLHPLSVESPLPFRQEGWHYELDSPDGELTRNGVVFNEMKGAFADPDEVLSYELGRGLYPDNCYGYESGGHPEHIPELTYENYLASHARFYHPSNAYIFLDGQVDLDAVLERLDSYLEEYDRIDVDADIPFQKPVHPAEITAEYEIGPEDDGTDKVMLGRGWVYGRFDKPERSFAASILAQALCGSNESPLKKAILEAGLAQDVYLYNSDGTQQHSLNLVVHNTSAEKKDKLLAVIDRVLEEQCQGLDHRQLHAILNQVEFSNREKDFGRMPRGLVFAMFSLESWLYGGDPAQNLDNSRIFASLREQIDNGGFEKLLREMTLDNPHTATVVLMPSKTLGRQRMERDKAYLASVKAGWSQEETQRVIDEFAKLRLHQNSADAPEAVATLPVLALSDIPEELPALPYSQGEFQGVPYLRQELETGGIVYLDMHFTADDLTPEELKLLPMACSLLGELGTEKYSALEANSLIREKLGRLTVSPTVYTNRHTGKVTPVVTVSLSVLPERLDDAVELLDQILLHTRFDDTAAVFNFLRQNRIGLEQTAMNAGNTFAAIRASSAVSSTACVTDALRGVTQLRYLQETEKGFEESGQETAAAYGRILARVFCRRRVTLALAGEENSAWLGRVLGLLPEGERGGAVTYKPLAHGNEGFSIPAQIGFAAMASRLESIGAEFDGSMEVAANLLRLDYLWNNVRVKGGAYGVNLGVSQEGAVSFTSYRDPHCAGSLDTFAAAGTALREFAAGDEALDKYIISTIGGTEPLTTPRQENGRAAAMYFGGVTQADRQQVRSQILHTTREQLTAFAGMLDQLVRKDSVCVVAAKPILDDCGNKIESIQSIQ